MAKNTTVALELSNGATAQVMGPYRYESVSWGLQVQVGHLQYGQSRDVVFKLKLPEGKTLSSLETEEFIAASVKFVSPDGHTVTVNPEREQPTVSVETEVQRLRLAAVSAILAAVAPGLDFEARKTGVHTVLSEIQHANSSDPRVRDLKIDLEGQVVEALSKLEYYNKWGFHYLPSLAHAHFLQQCNNFKDPGVQHYGGKLFETLRDAADDIFLAIPPPKPSRPARSSSGYGSSGSSHAAAYSAPVSMSGYYSSSAPCFAGTCVAMMADGTTKALAQLRAGDRVATPSGPASIVCIVETVFTEPTALVSLPGGLLVTPYHPIRENGAKRWEFPCNLGKTVEQPINSLFSFLLSSEHVMLINDYECIGLAHGVEDDSVAQHSFFGTTRVVDNLKLMKGWSNGHIRLRSGCVVRDSKTGLVNRLNVNHEI